MVDPDTLSFWAARAEEAEARLRWVEAETHESLRILQWAPTEEVSEQLALHAYAMEQLALGCRDALREAVAKHAADAATIARLERRVRDLAPRRRSRTGNAQVAA